MLPVNTGGHSTYQNFVVKNLRKYYPNPDALSRSTWDIIDRFWNLDLSYTDELMRSRYSVFGPRPRTPSCMQRSYLLSIDFKVTSLTDWAAQLKINPLYAILSGFEVGDTPGVGTFYDFLNRLWDSDSDNLNPHVRPVKSKEIKKPKQKGAKAESVEKTTVEQLLKTLEQKSFSIDEQPYGSLFRLYQKEFLEQSVKRELITPESLAVAGDGTPVMTSHRERRKRICDCAEKGITDCKCDRYFSQPDCDIGWDSSRDCFYHGYGLYMIVASDSDSDLPVFPLLNPASKHDSHGFLETYFRMKSFLPDFHVNKWLLDSAHDAMPYYLYCRKNGCSCEHPCSDSKYGRTVHLAMKDNPRLINFPPRDSEAWKKEYDARTSAERSNKREKIDFKLEDGRHRSTKMWYCHLYHILMLQHMDAWDLPFESTLRKLILNVA